MASISDFESIMCWDRGRRDAAMLIILSCAVQLWFCSCSCCPTNATVKLWIQIVPLCITNQDAHALFGPYVVLVFMEYKNIQFFFCETKKWY